MQRELFSDPFEVNNTLLVNFERPRRGEQVQEDRPSVQAVRLRGTQLQDHPEVCSLITRQRHLFEVQLRLRFWTNKQANIGLLPMGRITWADNHLVVMTGDVEGELSADIHRRLVRLVRDAAGRDVDVSRIRLLLGRIQRNAVKAESDQLDRVLTAQDGAAQADGDGEQQPKAG